MGARRGSVQFNMSDDDDGPPGPSFGAGSRSSAAMDAEPQQMLRAKSRMSFVRMSGNDGMMPPQRGESSLTDASAEGSRSFVRNKFSSHSDMVQTDSFMQSQQDDSNIEVFRLKSYSLVVHIRTLMMVTLRLHSRAKLMELFMFLVAFLSITAVFALYTTERSRTMTTAAQNSAPQSEKFSLFVGAGSAYKNEFPYVDAAGPEDLTFVDMKAGFEEIFSSVPGRVVLSKMNSEQQLLEYLSGGVTNGFVYPGSVAFSSASNDTQEVHYTLFYNNTVGEGLYFDDTTISSGREVPALMHLIHSVIWYYAAQHDGVGKVGLYNSMVRALPESGESVSLNVLPQLQPSVLTAMLMIPIPRIVFHYTQMKENGFRSFLFENGVARKTYALCMSVVPVILCFAFCLFGYLVGFAYGLPVFVQNGYGMLLTIWIIWTMMIVVQGFAIHLCCSHARRAMVLSFSAIAPIIALAAYLNSAALFDESVAFSSLQFLNFVFPPFTLYRAFVHLTNTSVDPADGATLSNMLDNDLQLHRILFAFAAQFVFLGLSCVAREAIMSDEFGPRKSGMLSFFWKRSKTNKVGASDGYEAIRLPVDVELSAEIEKERRTVKALLLERDPAKDVPMRLTGLSKKTQRTPQDLCTVADNVDLICASNQVTVIIVPDCLEKREMFALLCGESVADNGFVAVRTRATAAKSSYARIALTTSSMHETFPGDMTPRQLLTMLARMRSCPAAAELADVRETLLHFKLAFAADLPAKSFSPAMYQRLKLACAFVGFPEVVILEEPFQNLDETSQDVCSETIRKLSRGSRAVVVLTSEVEKYNHLADKIALINHGLPRVIMTPETLNALFEKQYWLFLSLESGIYEDEVDSFVFSVMPNAKAMWIHGELKAYVVEADDVMLSIVFEEFDRNASRLHILDWSLTTEDVQSFFNNVKRNNL